LHDVTSKAQRERQLGGEEFTVLLPGTSLLDGKRVIERVCADVRANAHVVVDTQTITVTCSAGLTSLSESIDLVLTADRALYMAKSAGRNRVAVLNPETDLSEQIL
jgi:diguanylate cyclase (GGDEF)-like protein